MTDCGRRVGHHATISLCMYHHRGVPLDGWFDAEMVEAFGPAASHGTRLFREAFGTDESLLLEQNKLLEGNDNGTGN